MTSPLLIIKRSRLQLESDNDSEQDRLSTALHRAGGYCFKQLTLTVKWASKEQRRALRDEFRDHFEMVIRENEQRRFEDDKYCSLVIRRSPDATRDPQVPYYLKLALARMEDMVEVAWPPSTVVWIDVRPGGVEVKVRDKDHRFSRVLYPKWVHPYGLAGSR
ncbi:MAG TPA: hypothetical protein VN081_00210 [Dongiaceae bacterium]|nr:hypothetical protein [Dongiaceae bacterium]